MVKKLSPNDSDSGFNRRKFLLGAVSAVPGLALVKTFNTVKVTDTPSANNPIITTETVCVLDESPLLNLTNPSDVVFSNNNIWVTEARGYRVRYTTMGSAFSSSEEFAAGSNKGNYNFPLGLTALPDGTLIVADTWNHRLVILDDQGHFQGFLGGWTRRDTPDNSSQNPVPGYEAGQYHAPEGISTLLHQDRTFIAVADCRNHRVQVLVRNLPGGWDATFIVGALGQKDENLRLPSGCALWQEQGNLYLAVVDRGHNRSDGGMGRVKVFIPAASGKVAGKVYLYSHDLDLSDELNDPRRVIALKTPNKNFLAVSGVVGKAKNLHGRIVIFEPLSGKITQIIDLINPTITNPLGLAQCPSGDHLAVVNHGRYPDRDDRGEDGFIQILRLSL